MSAQQAMVARHFAALIAEAAGEGIPKDVIARTMLARVVDCWREERSWQDVANELRFTADSLDPDTDFEFMRP
ncbi:MAG: hypothetical protein H6748_00105 [Spirochaetaceae bacterium]|nr:hypothetical protein [Myxococcales bacterium]MCB9722427.1 hypothetical protein [Spirochaetaceae bacterium]HPG26976.1 hypothetical protein [Myxococcota bacterium]